MAQFIFEACGRKEKTRNDLLWRHETWEYKLVHGAIEEHIKNMLLIQIRADANLNIGWRAHKTEKLVCFWREK